MYIYDNPAEDIHINGFNAIDQNLQPGEFIYDEKQLNYWLEALSAGPNAHWVRVSDYFPVAQVITIERVAKTGVVTKDFKAIENSITNGTVDLTMTAAKAAAIVGSQPNNILAPIPNDNYNDQGQPIP